MKTAIIAVGTALIFGISGYVVGGYNGVTRMVRDSLGFRLRLINRTDKELEFCWSFASDTPASTL